MVLVLLLVATLALGYGWSQQQSGYVVAALGLSLLAAVLVLAPHVLPLAARLRKRSDGTVVDTSPASASDGPDEPDPHDDPDDETVLFVAGRTTFHRESCAVLGGRPASSAQRAQLEIGGMTACARCHPSAT